MKWQPIETAPKDGEPILGVWWADISRDQKPVGKVGIVWWAGSWCPYAREITHWMPLPPSPQESATKASDGGEK